MATKWVYLFKEGSADMKNLLGGKGANLAEMTNLGLPIPQGFTVTTEACTDYYTSGKKITDEIQGQIFDALKTLEEIQDSKSLGEIPEDLMHPITPDVDFMVGDLEVKPFRIDHDAANPVAYRVQNEKRSVAVATDMGHYSQYIIDHLQNLDALLLEANHDVNMLETGPYPYYLKRRILGDHGHLSNENAGRLLNYILNDKLKHILLGHLSKENNYEALAYETVRFEIDQGDTPYKAKDFPIEVAKRDEMSQIIHL